MMVDYSSAKTMLPLDFVAHCMHYWRGGIEVDLEFICSAYDQLKVSATFSPNTNVSVPRAAAMTQYYTTMMIKGTNNRYRFKIPHFADAPWKLIWSGQTLADDDLGTDLSCDYMHGVFQVFLESNISSPESTPNTITMNVYVGASDDFQVGVMSMRNSSIEVGLTSPLKATPQRKPVKKQG